jgi:hypothetical protein
VIAPKKRAGEDDGLMVENDFGDDFGEDDYEDDFDDGSANKDSNIFENSRTKDAANKSNKLDSAGKDSKNSSDTKKSPPKLN